MDEDTRLVFDQWAKGIVNPSEYETAAALVVAIEQIGSDSAIERD